MDLGRANLLLHWCATVHDVAHQCYNAHLFWLFECRHGMMQLFLQTSTTKLIVTYLQGGFGHILAVIIKE